MELYKSKFRSQWYGVIVKREKRGKCDTTGEKQADLVTMSILYDKNKNIPIRRILKTIDLGWLRKVKDLNYDL